jgi:hypothetical protein
MTPEFMRKYDRQMLRSAFVSMFWAVIADRKRRDGYRLLDLADALRVGKSVISKWFSRSGSPANWNLSTMADIASALDVEIDVQLRERSTGVVYKPSGKVTSAPQAATVDPVIMRVGGMSNQQPMMQTNKEKTALALA